MHVYTKAATVGCNADWKKDVCFCRHCLPLINSNCGGGGEAVCSGHEQRRSANRHLGSVVGAVLDNDDFTEHWRPIDNNSYTYLLLR
jgi:hypothetical protein